MIFHSNYPKRFFDQWLKLIKNVMVMALVACLLVVVVVVVVVVVFKSSLRNYVIA